MKIGKPQGAMILTFGLILLTGGILVLITVPSWGDWIAGYPATVLAQQIPTQAAPTVQAMINFVFGPLLVQVGSYIKTAGYFGGTLLSLAAIGMSSVGAMIIRKAE
jgi:hypothetical protein